MMGKLQYNYDFPILKGRDVVANSQYRNAVASGDASTTGPNNGP